MYLTQGLHRSLRHSPDEPATILDDRVRSFAEQADRAARLAGGKTRQPVKRSHADALVGPRAARDDRDRRGRCQFSPHQLRTDGGGG